MSLEDFRRYCQSAASIAVVPTTAAVGTPASMQHTMVVDDGTGILGTSHLEEEGEYDKRH